ncbi:isopenicillin N synthase family dioxygenase [Aurantiacibacter flavus]|uniref:2-oxoglutarate-dependent ethylene/succinate-forming enzyme n=1 Tax=Aurantiacibacter flavus TaxID=3145232 RepID=A0ABV0CW13_9SPHN
MTQIATLSLRQPLDSLASGLGHSFSETGFAIVRDHGIAPETVARADAAMRAYFALPEPVKLAYRIAGQGGARGYTPFGAEHAKDAEVHDLKEFWHVGRELPAGDPLARYMPENVWPVEVPDFRPASLALFAEFETAGGHLLEAIAVALGQEPGFFSASVDQGNSVLRYLHYPPVAAAREGAVRAAAHEDINTITLLLGAEEAGLELLTRDGEWLAVSPPEGALVVNVGDMLQRLTAGKLRSTTHRVVNPKGEAAGRSRYSMPFFLHFRPDYVITPLVEGGEEPITADAYLQQRLREIGLV